MLKLVTAFAPVGTDAVTAYDVIGEPTIPEIVPELEMVGVPSAALIAITIVAELTKPFESVMDTVPVKVPDACGTPVIVPCEALIPRPGGNPVALYTTEPVAEELIL